jgi:MFS family permease
MSSPQSDAYPAPGTGVTSSLKPWQIALAALIGTTIEWYDFFIYGTAATLALAKEFFPTVSPTAGTLAALATYAVGFAARPIGGALAGHLGDRLGRKQVLALSLLVMGGATALVGVLPTYRAIGVAAPVLLIVLRLIQGLGVGGEWGGAVVMSLEHAPPARRTLFAAFPQLGLPAGLALSSLSFLLLKHVTSGAAFQAWGWRIPFLASAVLVGLGLYLRSRVGESPEFAHARQRAEVSRVPVARMFKAMPLTVVQATGANVANSGIGNIVFIFTLSYVAGQHLASSSTMLIVIVGAAAANAVGIYAGVLLAASLGRRRAMLLSLALCVIWAFPYFELIDTGSIALISLACAVGALCQGIGGGPVAAFIADAFPVSLRYTGAAVSYGLSGVAGGSVAPLVATALVAATGTSVPVSAYVVVLGLVSVVSAATLRSPEQARVPEPASVSA